MALAMYLVLSTAHVRHATAELLTLWSGLPATEQPLAVSPTLCGWFVPTAADHGSLPQDLVTVLVLGRRLGCSYVLLDSDGEETAELPIYPW